MIVQRDRNYVLRVGELGKQTLVISGLQISFTVKKSSNNKQKGNNASVSIYNLSQENRDIIEGKNIHVSLDVGYADTGLHNLFTGQVTWVVSKRQGLDIVTTLTLDTLYSAINNRMVGSLVSPGASVKTLLQRVAKDIPEVSKTKFVGKTLDRKLPDGYPYNGTPRQVLSEICDAYGLEWQIDGDVLTVSDYGYSTMTNAEAFLLNEMSGLLERPTIDEVDKPKVHRKKGVETPKVRGKRGLSITCLLNPVIQAGGTIKLEFGDLSGYYKVIELTHSGEMYGDRWETTVSCIGKEN
jgi:hypothetical protein